MEKTSPKVAASLDKCLCVYKFAGRGGGHGMERPFKEDDSSVERELTFTSAQALLCYSEGQSSL